MVLVVLKWPPTLGNSDQHADVMVDLGMLSGGTRVLGRMIEVGVPSADDFWCTAAYVSGGLMVGSMRRGSVRAPLEDTAAPCVLSMPRRRHQSSSSFGRVMCVLMGKLPPSPYVRHSYIHFILIMLGKIISSKG